MMLVREYEGIINYGWPKTKFVQRNTTNADKNDVNKQNRHTKHLEKNKIGRGWGGRGGESRGPTMILDAFEFLFFETSKEVDTFLSLRFFKK